MIWLACGQAILLVSLGLSVHAQPGGELGDLPREPTLAEEASDEPLILPLSERQKLGNLFYTILQMNQMEIEKGLLARRVGGSRQVRSFGDRMARDHVFISSRFEILAEELGIVVDVSTVENTEELMQPVEERYGIESLRGLAGSDFDTEYLNISLNVHKQTIQTLHLAERTAKINSLHTFLLKLIPIFEQHQSLGQILKDKLITQTVGANDG